MAKEQFRVSFGVFVKGNRAESQKAFWEHLKNLGYLPETARKLANVPAENGFHCDEFWEAELNPCFVIED